MKHVNLNLFGDDNILLDVTDNIHYNDGSMTNTEPLGWFLDLTNIRSDDIVTFRCSCKVLCDLKIRTW